MSGHSHYSTIKRQKEAKDAARGQTFSKLAKAIQIAVRSGGSPDPEANYKLRMAIEQARAANLPKDNIDRAISKGVKEGENLEEVSYEGYGPGGIAIIVESATDNRNRTAQEIKNLFERGGGSLAGPGAVSFNFEPKALIVVRKQKNLEEQMLKLIDAGVDDLNETDSGVEVYVSVDKLSEIKDKLKGLDFEITTAEVVKKPKNLTVVSEPNLAQKLLRLLDDLEEHGDVQKVYANLDIPDSTLSQIQNPS